MQERTQGLKIFQELGSPRKGVKGAKAQPNIQLCMVMQSLKAGTNANDALRAQHVQLDVGVVGDGHELRVTQAV